ncbi:MAG: acyltransferase [Cyclobacteriaceae bacterium]|nr:acyltransferase [Cyclobacteriaceae bacterium]
MSSTVAGKTKNHRRGWIDYARGFVIIYVVYRHALTGLLGAGVDIKNAIYLVQESSMPVFFIVSGVFISSSALKRGFGTFVRFKIESLMYPYFVWATIHLTIQILFSQYSNFSKDISYYIYLFTYPRAIDQFWYLYALFAVMVVFASLNFKLVKFNVWLNVLIALGFYFASYYIKTDLFSLHDIMFYYIFLVFGFLMAGNLLPVESSFFRGRWLLYTLPVFIAIQILWRMWYPDINKLDDLDYIGFILFVPTTIIGALLIFFISYKLDEWGLIKILRFIGSHSLYIYIMHLIFTSAIRIVMLKIYPEAPPILMLIVIMVGGVFIPIVCYRILIKLGLNGLFVPPQRIKNLIYWPSKPQ